jgi:hypothetical protein
MSQQDGRNAFCAAGFMLCVAAVALTMAATPLLYREKPPEGHTGGFGEPACTACHLPESPDPPTFDLQLRGLPPLYDAGRRYELVLELSARPLEVGGFQLAARFADGSQQGRQAGRFQADDAGVLISRVDSTGVEYVSHSAQGISATRDTLRWRFTWIAPASAAATVDFHFAANASNDDASALGDRIRTGSLRARLRAEKH